MLWRVCTGIVFAILLVFCPRVQGQNSTSTADSTGPGAKPGTLVETHEDKRVVQTGRWYIVRQFTVDFAVKCSNQTYCGEVTTTIVNEVDDLMASKDRPVELRDGGKDIDVTLPNGRHIKAHQVSPNKCEQN